MYRDFLKHVALFLGLIASSAAMAGSTFEFRTPTGYLNPVYNSASLTVPNDYVFYEINALETDLEADLRAAILASSSIAYVNWLNIDFENPEVSLRGVGTSVVGRVAGIDQVYASVRIRIPSWARLLCGSYLNGSVDIRDLAVSTQYDYYNGVIQNVDIERSSLNVNVGCSNIIGDLILDLIQVFVDIDDLASDFVDGAADDIAGRYQNLFSLQDALQGLQVSGNREIQEAAEDALGYLGGVRSAAANFIANEITDDLIDRLNLQTQAEINQLQERLAGLVDYLAINLPQLDTMTLSQLASANFDLSNYLTVNLPGLRYYLINQLNGYYADAVAAVGSIEADAIQALEDFVGTDWASIFGGVNVRLRVYRSSHRVVLDAFHDAPSKFDGRAEANAPCFPDYTVQPVANAKRYRIFNSVGDVYYEGLDRTHVTDGLLRGVIAESRLGLKSYMTPGTVTLYAWGDYWGDPADFRWPLCPVAQPIGGGGSTPPPSDPPPEDPPPSDPPPPPPPSDDPPWDPPVPPGGEIP